MTTTKLPLVGWWKVFEFELNLTTISFSMPVPPHPPPFPVLFPCNKFTNTLTAISFSMPPPPPFPVLFPLNSLQQVYQYSDSYLLLYATPPPSLSYSL